MPETALPIKMTKKQAGTPHLQCHRIAVRAGLALTPSPNSRVGPVVYLQYDTPAPSGALAAIAVTP